MENLWRIWSNLTGQIFLSKRGQRGSKWLKKLFFNFEFDQFRARLSQTSMKTQRFVEMRLIHLRCHVKALDMLL